MTITHKTLATLGIALLLVASTKAACLSNQTLTSLGFSNLGVSSFPNNTATYCTNLFNQYGSCVDQNAVKDRLNQVNDNLKLRIDDGEGFKDVFSNLKGKVVRLFSSSNSTAIDAAFQAINDAAAAGRNKCLRALAILNDGAYCYLASQAASSFGTDLAASVEIKVNATQTGAMLEDCLPIIDATCASSYGNPISIAGIYNITNSNALNITNATCNDLKNTYSCGIGDNSCVFSRRTTLVNLFIGNEIRFVPNKTILDKIKDFFGNLFGRRLQSTNKPITFNAQFSTGENVATDGSYAGVDIPTTSTAAIVMAGAVGLFMAQFA